MLLLSSVLRRHHRRHFRRILKSFSTSPLSDPPPPPPSPPPLNLPLSHPTFLVWSSNTSLGKTLVSAGLASSFLLPRSSPPFRRRRFLYLKPLQTGFPSDSDSHFVFRTLSSLSSSSLSPLLASHRVLRTSDPDRFAIVDSDFREEFGAPGAPAELVCETMFAWREAVSPHLAAERESGSVEDSAVLRMLQRRLDCGLYSGVGEEKMDAFCVVETAGGVASPGPSGTLQCDLYR